LEFSLEILGIMSDLSISRSALDRSRSQLGVAAYFDAAQYELEQARIFSAAPRYVAHSLSVPAIGDYHALPQEGEGRVLVNTPSGLKLLSNVCRHRQAVMLRGRGQTGSQIVCPLHRWTYRTDGHLIAAPHFADDPCLNLNHYPLQVWNGLVFEGGERGERNVASDLAGLGPKADFDFSGYVLDRIHLHECDYNWKTFIQVYLEYYHVGLFHPGLGNFVTCEDLRWEMGPDYSVQTVGIATPGGKALGRPGSDVYKKWHDVVLGYRDGKAPAKGAVWLTCYPTVMLEWYPHVLVVSTLFPSGPRKTLNVVEFFYPEEICAFEREFVEAQQAAYMETCVEDDQIALRMDAGRAALLARGDDEYGPYQSPMEDGMQQFHEWYRRALGTAP
jgi:choline monooxygenase